MQFKPKKNLAKVAMQKRIDGIAQTDSQYLTEEELAALLDMNVRQAVKKAVALKFNRIPKKGSFCYSKKQVLAWLNGECHKQ